VKNYVVIRLKNNRIVESAAAIGSVGVCMRGVEAKWRETSKKGIVLKERSHLPGRQTKWKQTLYRTGTSLQRGWCSRVDSVLVNEGKEKSRSHRGAAAGTGDEETEKRGGKEVTVGLL